MSRAQKNERRRGPRARRGAVDAGAARRRRRHDRRPRSEAPAPAAPEEEVDEATRERLRALDGLRAKIAEHKEVEAKLKEARASTKDLVKEFEDTENALNALQSVGQIIGDVLRRLDEERFIVKASSGPRYVVGCRNKLDKEKLKPGTRVTLDMTTLTIMRALPSEVDPTVYHMLNEDPGGISFGEIGGLGEQVRELREVIELPLTNPELFVRVGIKPPKGVLLYGPPGTGKTLLARALASNINATFLKVVASAIVDKYIGESRARSEGDVRLREGPPAVRDLHGRGRRDRWESF